MGGDTVWGGVHPMPAPTNAQQAHNIQNLHGSWLVGATFKLVPLMGANFQLVIKGGDLSVYRVYRNHDHDQIRDVRIQIRFRIRIQGFFSCIRIQTSKRQIQIGIRIQEKLGGFRFGFCYQLDSNPDSRRRTRVRLHLSESRQLKI